MTDKPADHADLLALLAALCDGDISPEQFAQLNDILEQDVAARTFYIRYIDLHDELPDRVAADAEAFFERFPEAHISSGLARDADTIGVSTHLAHLFDEAEYDRAHPAELRIETGIVREASERQINDRHRGRRWLTAAAVAAGILLTVSLSLVFFTSKAPPPTLTLVRSEDANFAGSVVIIPGQRLPAGEQRLIEGIAKVELDNGVNVVVVSPATFELTAANHLRIRGGLLSAYVPAQGSGFTVETPSATIVDLGTEFGVQVDVGGATQLHVFKGQVELRAKGANSSLKVSAGEARHVDASPDAVPAPIAFHERMFPDPTAKSLPPREITIGSELRGRPINDTAVGSIFVVDAPITVSGRVLDWAFYDRDNQPPLNTVTPLILKPLAPNRWEIVAIGRTRASNASGLQRYAFDVVAGDDRVVKGYAMGWKDGGATSNNAGVINYTNATPGTRVGWCGGGQTNVVVGKTVVVTHLVNRTYSLAFTLEPDARR